MTEKQFNEKFKKILSPKLEELGEKIGKQIADELVKVINYQEIIDNIKINEIIDFIEKYYPKDNYDIVYDYDYNSLKHKFNIYGNGYHKYIFLPNYLNNVDFNRLDLILKNKKGDDK